MVCFNFLNYLNCEAYVNVAVMKNTKLIMGIINMPPLAIPQYMNIMLILKI